MSEGETKQATGQAKPKNKKHEILCQLIGVDEIKLPVADWDSWELQTSNLKFRDIFRITIFEGASEIYPLTRVFENYIPVAVIRETDITLNYLIVVTSCHQYYEPPRNCIKIWLLKELKE